MGSHFDLARLDKIVSQAREYFFQHMLSGSMAAQLAVAACALLAAYKVVAVIRAWITRQQSKCSSVQDLCYDLKRLTHFSYVIGPALGLILLWIPYCIAEHLDLPRDGLYAIVICLVALTLVRLLTGQMQNRFWATIIGRYHGEKSI
ncbi:hypothetical protein [Desulfobacca acetoxidans]|uniref:Mechanosensitive ion channel family protein n=1 Tax=Desulfobacca acetoxidans (strain ATCC 700848 / DSM 11109 / ASRB2) TaxID=880072 RepID=F2NFS2_DESAR|nr:hypothetical protein [Desulfobacca acetoxidans]AEB10191.1 hypothetical protein Desac_2369 [Desulfobacca acetoxidans DSM 11109]